MLNPFYLNATSVQNTSTNELAVSRKSTLYKAPLLMQHSMQLDSIFNRHHRAHTCRSNSCATKLYYECSDVNTKRMALESGSRNRWGPHDRYTVAPVMHFYRYYSHAIWRQTWGTADTSTHHHGRAVIWQEARCCDVMYQALLLATHRN